MFCVKACIVQICDQLCFQCCLTLFKKVQPAIEMHRSPNLGQWPQCPERTELKNHLANGCARFPQTINKQLKASGTISTWMILRSRLRSLETCPLESEALQPKLEGYEIFDCNNVFNVKPRRNEYQTANASFPFTFTPQIFDFL